MTHLLLFLGCLLLAATVGILLTQCRTSLLGLNILNLFTVASATLSTFFFGTIFDLLPKSFSDEQVVVVSYSVAGLLAMVLGIYLGWRPLIKQKRARQGLNRYAMVPDHFSEQIGWLSFVVGATFELGSRYVYDIPTISTAFNCLASLARLGLFILLIRALHDGRWNKFVSACAIYAMMSILGALTTGFSFIRINTLIPLFMIWYGFRGLTFRNVTAPVATLLLATPFITAWLDTRNLIREGTLEGYSLLNQAAVFFREYVVNLDYPSPTSIMRTIVERVDMTDILAAQVRYQPDYEPYAFGETIYSSFYTLIPRFLWPDKPIVAGGSEFVARFTGLYRAADDATSVGLPYPFELFANGGWFFVVLGLGVIGYIGARLELGLFRRAKSLGAFWARGLVTIVICEGGQRTDVILPALVASALAAYVLGKVLEDFWARKVVSINVSTNRRSPIDERRWRVPPR